MNHFDFIDKWGGKKWHEPGLDYQCVGLAKKYYEEVFGITGLYFGGSAINAWLGKGNLDRILDRVKEPQEGDMIFYKASKSNGFNGHVAIYDTALSILEQNGGKGTGTGLGTDSIRIIKRKPNPLGYMRNRTIADKDIPIIRQHSEPDCSLASVINCYRLNNPLDGMKIDQSVANKYMVEYIAKHPRQAFEFLKEKGHNLKYLPLTFPGAKVRLKKGSAVVCFLHYTFQWHLELVDDRIQTWRPNTKADQTKPHYFVLKAEGDKMYVYDSNFAWRYEIEDWERFVDEKVIGQTFYQIR